MNPSFWHKQTKAQPLFPDFVWSRPENRAFAGKLLIIGGNMHGFAAPAEAYAESVKAGIGTARALLPDAIKKFVGILIENADFTPSTPSGSFSQKSLAEWLAQGMWADGTLFAGDLGRNSETAIVIEKYLQKIQNITVLTRDAADYVISAPQSIAERSNTLLVVSLSQLQRLATATGFHRPVTFSMDMLRLVDWLHEYTARYGTHIIVRHLHTTFVAVNGQVSTMPATGSKPEIWRLKTATHAAVWWVQNPERPFEALTTAVHQI